MADRSREVIAEVRRELMIGRPLATQRVLQYIVDEAGPADIVTIKRLAAIALGRSN